jgi:flagellar basal-body rod protein FlgC
MALAGLFSGLNISASGMHAMRVWQETISSNLANAETTRTDKGGPYRRQFVVLEADADNRDTKLVNEKIALEGRMTSESHLPIPPSTFPRDERFFGNGVHVSEIREDSRPSQLVYDPSHPDADAKGYVAMPNVNIVKEMTDMIAASRAYEANATAFNSMKSMLMQSIQI